MSNDQIVAVIYKPTKTAMQSGYIVNDKWVLKFLPKTKIHLDPLMGWSGSDDTSKQVILKFDNLEEAEEYAKFKGLKYRVLPLSSKNIKPKSYAENFSFNRKVMWTH